ncbi:MAG: hypothetical protein ACTSWA_06550 [Candidatus Thorarchaeota archaeon]
MEIPTVLKYTFIFHMIVAFVLGAWFFIAPNTWVDLVGWPYFDPSVDRVMASLMIAFGVTSFLGLKADSYEKVEIVVIGEIVYALLATIAMFWFMLAETTAPMIGWALAGLQVVFLVLFGYSYYIAKE